MPKELLYTDGFKTDMLASDKDCPSRLPLPSPQHEASKVGYFLKGSNLLYYNRHRLIYQELSLHLQISVQKFHNFFHQKVIHGQKLKPVSELHRTPT